MNKEKDLELISEEKKEEWKHLKFNGELLNYDVSNFGNIRKHDTKFVLKPSKNKKMKNCYLFITLKNNDGCLINTGIHRLVAMMFVDISDEHKKAGLGFDDLTVDHLDGIKYNNVPENLEWVTMDENVQRRIFRDPYCTRRLTSSDVKAICKLLCANMSYSDIAEMYDVSECTISSIRYGVIWKDVSKNFVFPTARMSKEKILKIADYLMEGRSIDEIAKLVNTRRHIVERIKYKQSWANITKDYVFPLKQIKENDAHIICKLLQDGKSVKYIHEEYGYTKNTIKSIRRGHTWKNVSKDYNISSSKYKVKDEIVIKICQMLEKQIPMTIIADETGVSYGFVKCIKARKYRKDITVNFHW